MKGPLITCKEMRGMAEQLVATWNNGDHDAAKQLDHEMDESRMICTCDPTHGCEYWNVLAYRPGIQPASMLEGDEWLQEIKEARQWVK